MAGALAVVGGSSLLLLSGFLTLILLLRLFSPRPRPPTALSLRYLTASNDDASSDDLHSLPQLPSTLDSAATLELSVVVPAYDEELRLRDGISSALEFLEARRIRLSSGSHVKTRTSWSVGSYEVVIVDDGSKDRTVEVALEIAREHRQTVLKSGPKDAGEVRIVRLGRNRGKGGAVRHGMLHARGAKILFADADGASHFPDLDKLLAAYDRIAASTPRRRPARPPSELPSLSSQIPETLGSLSPSLSSRRPSATAPTPPSANGGAAEEEEDQAMVLGSRAHLVSSPSVVSRSPLRNLLMRAFHLYLYVLGVRAVKDTQCGFKLLSRGTVRDLVSALHVEGWIFDVELLLLSSLLRPPVPVEEVPIAWNEVGGSKLSVVRDSAVMALELLVIRLNYGLGVWSVPNTGSR